MEKLALCQCPDSAKTVVGQRGTVYGPSTFLLEAVLQFSAFWGSAAGREGRLIKRKAAHHAEPSLMLGFGVTGSRNLDLGCSVR